MYYLKFKSTLSDLPITSTLIILSFSLLLCVHRNHSCSLLMTTVVPYIRDLFVAGIVILLMRKTLIYWNYFNSRQSQHSPQV